jgi:hypothetical protein
MKLELAEFPVKAIRLGHRFGYADQVLDLDEGAVLALLAEDPRITDVKVAVAYPGEKTRITGIRDTRFRGAARSFREFWDRWKMSGQVERTGFQE